MEDRYIEGFENVPAELSGCVLTIGNFDGVHLGHQRILSVARKLANECGGKVVAMTFDPSPAAVLRPDAVPLRLSVMHRRVERLLECGADYVVVAEATPELLRYSADEFVKKIIMSRFSPKHMVEGYDFCYGSKRSGNIETLRESGAENGFDVHVVDQVEIELDGKFQVVSSSLIRNLIQEGRVERASECMGVDFVLAGEVVHGFGRGKTLEYPTANIKSAAQIIPANGVYAGIAIIDGYQIPAAVSIGSQPTFKEHSYAVEAFLIDQDGDFYSKRIWLDFVSRIRDQKKFENIEQLKHQIAQDVATVQQLIGKRV